MLPGVDLKLTATELGMASVYVVKNAAAAADPRMEDLGVSLEGADVSVDETGTFTADPDVESADVLKASSPLWWDSSNGGDADSPGENMVGRPVEHSVSDDGIALDVSATIDDAHPIYPIYVDPDWVSGQPNAWYVDWAYPDQSYLSANADTVLRYGRWAEHGGYMFFQFGIEALAGKQILAAQLSTYQLEWAACPNEPMQVRTFGPQQAGFTWNQMNHALWGNVLDTKDPGDHNNCGGGPEVVGWDVTQGVRDKLGDGYVQFGFMPQNVNNPMSRRHYGRGATLYVNYNSPPNRPMDPQIDSPVRQCGTAESPAYVSGSSVVVSIDQTDPDEGNVDTNIYLFRARDNADVIYTSTGLGAQGRRSVTFNGLADDTYWWTSRGSDWKIDGNGWSERCYFTVDNTKPAKPTVSTTATSFAVGKAVSVSMSGTSDVAGYQYWLSYSAATSTPPASPVAVSRTAQLPDCNQRVGGTRFKCGNGSTAVSVSVAPVDAMSTLWVSAYDKAGNVSTASAVKLYLANGTPAARDARVENGHGWLTTRMIAPMSASIEDANENPDVTPMPLTMPGTSWQTTSEVRPGLTAPVLRPKEPTAPNGFISTSSAAVSTSESFSVSMWVKPGNVASPNVQVIAEQKGASSQFQLQLAESKFRFCRWGTSTGSENWGLISTCITTPSTVATGEWTLVTAIWDRTNQQMRIDIGSSPTPLVVAPNLRGSTESWTSGSGFSIAPIPTSTRFSGLIANPVVVPGVLDSRQLGSLSQFASPFTS
ncbi:hypothetical protein NS183_05700 [Microbacterium testaceum]|nr:hypothetical protein NS183_05700 [Microbacterium testaceum]